MGTEVRSNEWKPVLSHLLSQRIIYRAAAFHCPLALITHDLAYVYHSICSMRGGFILRSLQSMTHGMIRNSSPASRSRSRSRYIYFSNASWRNMNNQSQTLFHPASQRTPNRGMRTAGSLVEMPGGKENKKQSLAEVKQDAWAFWQDTCATWFVHHTKALKIMLKANSSVLFDQHVEVWDWLFIFL